MKESTKGMKIRCTYWKKIYSNHMIKDLKLEYTNDSQNGAFLKNQISLLYFIGKDNIENNNKKIVILHFPRATKSTLA